MRTFAMMLVSAAYGVMLAVLLYYFVAFIAPSATDPDVAPFVPLYNGWIRRHRGTNQTRRPAPWRATPPVSDELWARVEGVRRAKTRGWGPKNWDRVDLLGGPLECVCGRQLRNDGTFADGRHRKHHANPCEARGRRALLGDQTWEGPVLAQSPALRSTTLP